ncbi:MAG: Co2+/Mg2+ efflux protein ApaG [Holosporaceae bacterium]|jgi:ApaG protein|nr:Co2+/Mg2+ efflux protein ApaG [Rhodospirillaceae bacterium]
MFFRRLAKKESPTTESTPLYSKITRSVRISVEPHYLADQSAPADRHFLWAYRVLIENLGNETVQLLSRYWRITNAFGQVQEVRGAGVVGEQPELEPGQSFEYTSGTPLTTPSGIMVGCYSMVTSGGEKFDVDIPAFPLDIPSQPKTLH